MNKLANDEHPLPVLILFNMNKNNKRQRAGSVSKESKTANNFGKFRDGFRRVLRSFEKSFVPIFPEIPPAV
jgi:hypothetical protein